MYMYLGSCAESLVLYGRGKRKKKKKKKKKKEKKEGETVQRTCVLCGILRGWRGKIGSVSVGPATLYLPIQ